MFIKTSAAAALLTGLPVVSVEEQWLVSESAVTSLFTLAILLLCIAAVAQNKKSTDCPYRSGTDSRVYTKKR